MEIEQPKRELLYYPYIDIPQKEWLYSALLYSDGISTIVPFQTIEDKKFPEGLKPLYDAGVYKPQIIEKILNDYKEEFWEFEQLFIETTKGDDFRKLRNVVAIKQPAVLYHQKMTDRIYRHLQNENLIKNEDADGGIITEQNSAFLYMSLLAQYVAKTNDSNLIIPSTDVKSYERIAFELTKNKIPAFSLLLDKLPVPNIDIPVKKILQFKKDRKDELYRFRKYISETQKKIRDASDRQEVIEILIETQEDIKNSIDAIQTTLTDGGIKTFFTSFDSLLKIENPKLFGTLTTVGVVTPINAYAGLATGVIGVIGSMVSSYLTTKSEVNKSEFSYLFKAKRENII